MNLSLRSLVFALATVGSASACRSLGRQALADPVVNLRDVRLAGVGITGATIDVVLSIYNPNDFRLDATKINYTLFADSERVGSGTVDNQLTAREKDSLVVTLPVTFSYAGLSGIWQRIQGSGVLNYRVTGDVTLGTPMGSLMRPFDRSGRFTVLRSGP